MSRKKFAGAAAVCAAVLLVSACGGSISGHQEKIAVIDWDKAVAGHPDYGQLQQGEKIFKDLTVKRRNQEKISHMQLDSLGKLRQLKDVSQRNFLLADLNTRMVEQQERENAKLQKFLAKTGQEADALIAERKKAVEDQYSLELFNLRLELENVHMKPQDREAVREKLAETRARREAELAGLMQERRAYMDSRMKPYVEEMRRRLGDFHKQQQEQMLQKLEEAEKKDSSMLAGAPAALNNALSIMDREIDRQQDKNDRLRRKIGGDIESIAVKLAHERSYTIVFNKYKANIKADDITEDIVSQLKMKK